MRLRYPFAVFYITPPGESDCEGIYVARSPADAITLFMTECGSEETEWEAHQLSAWNSKAWCEGYAESLSDADDRAVIVAQEKRKRALAKKESAR